MSEFVRSTVSENHHHRPAGFLTLKSNTPHTATASLLRAHMQLLKNRSQEQFQLVQMLEDEGDGSTEQLHQAIYWSHSLLEEYCLVLGKVYWKCTMQEIRVLAMQRLGYPDSEIEEYVAEWSDDIINALHIVDLKVRAHHLQGNAILTDHKEP